MHYVLVPLSFTSGPEDKPGVHFSWFQELHTFNTFGMSNTSKVHKVEWPGSQCFVIALNSTTHIKKNKYIYIK